MTGDRTMRGEAEILVEGHPVQPDSGWKLAWADQEHRDAILQRGSGRIPVLVEGDGSDWVVTIRGRRFAVAVRGHRDRLLAESTRLIGRHHGPVEVRATLPGLVVRVGVSPGDMVEAGDSLVTVEAMKMQNEIRAPRAGRIAGVDVTPGQAIANGALLVRLEELEP